MISIILAMSCHKLYNSCHFQNDVMMPVSSLCWILDQQHQGVNAKYRGGRMMEFASCHCNTSLSPPHNICTSVVTLYTYKKFESQKCNAAFIIWMNAKRSCRYPRIDLQLPFFIVFDHDA